MLDSRLQDISEESHYLQSNRAYEKTLNLQHGPQSSCNLLGIPSETLTGITAYLDPPTLFSLAKVNTALYHHVKDDNTWRWAFVSHYLGINPEDDVYPRAILLRRFEHSWRNEFIARFRLERKWEGSRSTSISHVPVPSVISSIHLMSYQVVLSSCLKYGIVARSLPLNGKVYSGYLSAAANDVGLGGIGNPNLEFAPNASTCSITSKGSSARILWGFLDGSVALVLADKVMNPRRITSELKRCRVREQHQGAVSDSAWTVDGLMAVTGGFDGQVKLWLADPLECIWASEVRLHRALPDPCLKVAVAVNQHQGYNIAAVFSSGEIHFWTGLDTDIFHSPSADQVNKTQILSPLREFEWDTSPGILPAIASLHINTNAEEFTTILIAYKDHPLFYRIRIGIVDGSVETTAFGDPSFGPISSISPFFATEPGQNSFVIVGDSLGCVSIYDWCSVPVTQEPVRPVVKFEAHEDGAAVTAIAWNGVILMTGSSRGSIHAWDGLNFTPLRSFAFQSGRRNRHHLQEEEANDQSIKQIILDASKDMFIAYACDRVLAWKALVDSTGKRAGRNTSKHVARRIKNGSTKYYERLEMKETITETRRMVEQENESYKRAFTREKEHRAKLEKLGLTEAEALEYVLMLSREEALGRGVSDDIGEEGVFDIDESLQSAGRAWASSSLSPHRSPSLSSVSTASDQTWSSYGGSPASYGRYGVQGLDASPSSPGPSVPSMMSAAAGPSLVVPTLSEDQFPPIAVSPTPSSTSGSEHNRSPSSGKNWSNVVGSSSSTSRPKRFRPVGAGGVKYASSKFHVDDDAEMDEDLRYALELSLAEAKSKSKSS